MWMHGNDPSGWMWLMMAAVMLGFWALVFLALASLWSTSQRGRSNGPNASPTTASDQDDFEHHT